MIKTRKIQIIPIGDKKLITETIKRYSEESCLMANEVVRNIMFNLKRYDDFKKENPHLKGEELSKEYSNTFGLTVNGFAYDTTKSYDIMASVRTALSNVLYKTINENKKNILSNKVSIPSFTKDKMPVYFRWKFSKLYTEENKYHFQISKNLTFTLHFGRDRSNNKSIVDKVLSGEYKGCDSAITIDGDKMFLNLSFKFEPQKMVVADENLVLGIDMGINRPITMGRSDNKYVPQIELGTTMLETRLQFHKRRRELSRGLKHAKGGRGRKEKMKRLDAIKQKEHNYVETMNHKLSKLVIDYCKQNNIGKIKMEDLTGITKDATDYYLKSWAYYQIESMIKYKSAEAGIEIEYVNPKDTSKMCHCCGVIQEDARSKEDVSKFVCQTVDCELFGKSQDADINAAKNISRKDGSKVKPKSKKGKIESWIRKQKTLEESLSE
jgi:IS605 OrfB family transposase